MNQEVLALQHNVMMLPHACCGVAREVRPSNALQRYPSTASTNNNDNATAPMVSNPSNPLPSMHAVGMHGAHSASPYRMYTTSRHANTTYTARDGSIPPSLLGATAPRAPPANAPPLPPCRHVDTNDNERHASTTGLPSVASTGITSNTDTTCFRRHRRDSRPPSERHSASQDADDMPRPNIELNPNYRQAREPYVIKDTKGKFVTAKPPEQNKPFYRKITESNGRRVAHPLVIGDL